MSKEHTGPRRPWRIHAGAILILAILHVAFLAAVTWSYQTQSEGKARSSWLTAIISKIGERRGSRIAAKPLQLSPEAAQPPTHWIFPTIGLWPSAHDYSATLSEFTPVVEAQADPLPLEPVKRNHLRMTRWLRPAYPSEWAEAGKAGTVHLNLIIAPNGQPTQITVTQSSGSVELDQATVSAARLWRFAPPLWNGEAIKVTCSIELQFNAR